MKMRTEVSWVSCPFCGEEFEAVVDPSEDSQTYVEDCFVCCRPITFHVHATEGELLSVHTSRDV